MTYHSPARPASHNYAVDKCPVMESDIPYMQKVMRLCGIPRDSLRGSPSLSKFLQRR